MDGGEVAKKTEWSGREGEEASYGSDTDGDDCFGPRGFEFGCLRVSREEEDCFFYVCIACFL